MKILTSGLGILVDQDHLMQLDTPAKINEEIDKVSTNQFEPVEADGQKSVVDVNDYLDFLHDDLKAVKAEIAKQHEKKLAAQKTIAEAKTAGKQEQAKKQLDQVNDDFLLTRGADIIARLVKLGKKQDGKISQLEHENDQIKKSLVETTADLEDAQNKLKGQNKVSAFATLNDDFDFDADINRGVISIKPGIRKELEKLLPNKQSKISEVGQIIILRGLYGDEKARKICDQLFKKGQYDQVVKQFEVKEN